MSTLMTTTYAKIITLIYDTLSGTVRVLCTLNFELLLLAPCKIIKKKLLLKVES